MTRLKRYTLVIIDMQPFFQAAKGNKKLHRQIKKAMDHAMRLGNHIMFVWIPSCGPVSRTLKAYLREYSNVSYVPKINQDGGREVLEALPNKTNLRFCGVNTDQCVQDTVMTVSKHYPKRYKIEVISDGCATYKFISNPKKSYIRHAHALKMMGGRPNIKIIKTA